MIRLFRNVFLSVFAFFVLYSVLFYLFNDAPIQNPLEYFISQLSQLGDVNIWLHLTEYWNNTFLPSWNALINPPGILEAIGAFFGFLFTLLWTPLQFLVIFATDVFGVFSTVFAFLNFGG